MIEGGSFFKHSKFVPKLCRSRETTIKFMSIKGFMLQTDFSIGNHLQLYYLIYDCWMFYILLLSWTALGVRVELAWTYPTCWTSELHHGVRNLHELVAPFLFISGLFVTQQAFLFLGSLLILTLFFVLVIVPSKYCRQVAFYTGPTGMNHECIINWRVFWQWKFSLLVNF